MSTAKKRQCCVWNKACEGSGPGRRPSAGPAQERARAAATDAGEEPGDEKNHRGTGRKPSTGGRDADCQRVLLCRVMACAGIRLFRTRFLLMG